MKRLLLLLFFLPIACARPGEKKAEQALAELLPEYLGPADRYRTYVQSDSLGAIMRGRMRTVRIEGTNVHLQPDLIVGDLTLEAAEVEVDLRARTLKGIGRAAFLARIEEASLDRFVRRHRPRLADLRVRLRGSSVEVSVRPEVFGYPTLPVTILGRLLPRAGGVTLDFDPDRARLSVVPIPGPILDFVAERLNPVVDLSQMAVPIRVEEAEVRAGALHLSGSVPPDDLVRWMRTAPAPSR